MPISWADEQESGKDRLNAFLKRHPDLSIRTPQPISLARATSFLLLLLERQMVSPVSLINAAVRCRSVRQP